MSESTYPWEPRYGFSSEDKVKMAAALEMVRRRVCAYGPDAVTCDCKYGISQELTGWDHPSSRITGKRHLSSEMTGCPELRSAIRMLLHGEDDS